MKAEAKPLNFITVEGLIKVPFFQRPYVWDEENWEKLFEDLADNRNYHFLGSIIFKQQNVSTGGTKEVLLIDGQQRLATICILLKAIYDNLEDDKKKNLYSTLEPYIYYKKNPTDSKLEEKIKLSKNDREDYKEIILNGNISDSTKESKLIRCYNYFHKKLKDDINEGGADSLDKLIEKIFSPIYKLFVIIDLEADDNEQEIFDTINSTGVRLSSADIIKNALFQKVLELNVSETELTDLYKKYWEDIFQSDKEKEDEWLKEKNTGRVKRDNIEILFHSYAVIKKFFDPENDNLSDLSSIYKKKLHEFKTIAEIEKFLMELTKYADIFYNNLISEIDLLKFDDQIHRTLHIINTLGLSTFYPLILFILQDTKLAKDREKYLQALEKYVIRRAIANKTTKNYNKEIKNFIKDINSLISASNDDTDDTEISGGLQNISNNKANLILFWIELYRRKDPKYDIKELKYTYTLEHILPTKWEEYWSDVNVYGENGNEITNGEEKKSVRNQFLKSIGNMTLLTSNLNSSLRNNNFERKINGFDGKKGIKDYADLSITQEILPSYPSINSWDERNITKRTQSLFGEVKNIWSTGL